MSDNIGLLLVGVGGQGVLTTSRILGLAALAGGLESRVGQIHGMSQRGGSLESTVVVGPGHTAYVSAGEVDILLAFDPLEAARALPRVTERTLAIVNSTPRVPYSMTSQGKRFPQVDELLSDLDQKVGRLCLFDATGVAREAGEAMTLGVVLLGALAELDALPFEAEVLLETLATEVRESRRATTLAAFQAGRTAAATLWGVEIHGASASSSNREDASCTGR